MNSVEKQTVLHCLKSMIDEEVCEECPLYGMTGTDHCEKDCVRLAINALEQEPCDDAISRQYLVEKATSWKTHFTDSERCVSLTDIQNAPPVTPTEKVGQWIDGKCNRCGTHAPYWAMASTYYCSDYCPSCGAKMQEVSRND